MVSRARRLSRSILRQIEGWLSHGYLVAASTVGNAKAGRLGREARSIRNITLTVDFCRL